MKRILFGITLILFVFTLTPAIASENFDYKAYLLKKYNRYENKTRLLSKSQLAHKLYNEYSKKKFFIGKNFDQLEKELKEKGYSKNHKIDVYLGQRFTYWKSVDYIVQSYLAHKVSKSSLTNSKFENTREIGNIAYNKFLFFYEDRDKIVSQLYANNIPAKQYKIEMTLNSIYHQKTEK